MEDLGYLADEERITYDIEEDAAGENGEELMNDRKARVKSAMGRLRGWVDERLDNAGINSLSQFALDHIMCMVSEGMIAQRDQTWECFESTGSAETLAESLAEQD